MAGGVLVWKPLWAKQLPPAAGAARPRSDRPDRRSTFPRTTLRFESHRFRSRLGLTKMPYAAWSSTTFPTTRSPDEPAKMIPTPNDGYSRRFDGASTLLLS